MIDASSSPRPAWQRYATIAALAVLLLVALFVIWKKELHHQSSGSANVNTPAASAPAALPVGKAPRSVTRAPATPVPGGVPVSSRNPFQG
jgi:hypothetical protein